MCREIALEIKCTGWAKSLFLWSWESSEALTRWLISHQVVLRARKKQQGDEGNRE